MACLGITGAMKSTPYCSNGGASKSDSTESIDYGGGKDGTL
jgi:hypothetical protein